MTRFLRPGRLVELESGLWAVDEVQPVAAVLDPVTGDVRQVVGWPELPPAAELPPGDGAWPPPRALGDGEALWVQQAPEGPLARVTTKGITTAAWTDGLFLAATAPGVAWCAPVPPSQELVQGEAAVPLTEPGPDVLLRVAADGSTHMVRTDSPVRSLRSTSEALLVEVDGPQWHLNDLGADTFEVEWETRWLRLPHDAPVPPALTVTEHGVDLPDVPSEDDGGRFAGSWYDTDDEEPVQALGFDWYLGWSAGDRSAGAQGRAPLWRRVVASANRDHEQVHGWDLGEGTVRAAAPAAGRLVVAVERPVPATGDGFRPVDLIALQPGAEDVETLLAADVLEIDEHCWPLVPRPLAVDSYLAQVLRLHQGATGLRDLRTALAGAWPATRLEWTFRVDTHPGVTIRRRVPLFDEVGRIVPPLYAEVNLLEDVETQALPGVGAAVDGVLDI